MHYNSLRELRIFRKEFMDFSRKTTILEVGSLNISKKRLGLNYKYFLDNSGWLYTGLDIIEGSGVDVVSKNLYSYPFADNTFDVVISGSTMEHVEDIYSWIKEISRVAKDLVFIVVPNRCNQHRHPVDCWRVFPDGMKFILSKIGGLEVIKCKTSLTDTVGVARKKKGDQV